MAFFHAAGDLDVIFDAVCEPGSFESGQKVLKKGGVFVSCLPVQAQSTADHQFVFLNLDGGKMNAIETMMSYSSPANHLVDIFSFVVLFPPSQLVNPWIRCPAGSSRAS